MWCVHIMLWHHLVPELRNIYSGKAYHANHANAVGAVSYIAVHATLLFFKEIGYPQIWYYIDLAQAPFFFCICYDFYQKSPKKKKYN